MQSEDPSGVALVEAHQQCFKLGIFAYVRAQKHC